MANVRVGIERLGETGGQQVNLDTGDRGAGVHLLRHQADEVPQSARRFEDAPMLESETRERRVHPANDDRRRVVGVECRGAGGRVLLVRQKLGQFDLLLEPLARVDIEHLRQPAPADVPDENRFLLVRSCPLLRLKATQQPNGSNVVAELLLERSLAETVAVGDPVVGLVAGWT